MAISILNNFRQLPLICPMLKSHKLSGNIYRKLLFRGLSSYKETFKFNDLEITPIESSQKKPKPDPNTLVFGKQFCDHMLEIEWDAIAGWGKPHICHMHDLILHPASKVFHYAQEVFEGMKAYRGPNGKVSLFRPMLNIQRMLTTSERAALPLFDGQEFLKCLKKLVSIDQEWVPNSDSSSLYIRPTYIGIEPSLGVAASKKALLYVICGPVGPYFSGGVREPVSLFASPEYVRAWPGGIGDKKMGANYAPTVYIQQQAASKNLQQVLWLYGSDHQITEVGTMNIFVFLVNKNNEKELITPPLNGIILPGITRHSVLEVVKKWNEFKVSERIITMEEVISAVNEDRLLEMFGVGTACVVCPIQSISYLGKVIKVPSSSNKDLNQRIFDTLTGIQDETTNEKAMVLLSSERQSVSCEVPVIPPSFVRQEVAASKIPTMPSSSSVPSTSKMQSPGKLALRRKIRLLQAKLRRRDQKITSMSDLITALKKQCNTEMNLISILENNFSGFSLDIFKNEVKNKKLSSGRRYNATFKEFALTVYFYSPKAYHYIRRHLNLPHPSLIKSWLSAVNCDPGLIKEVFDYLKVEVLKKSHLKNCALIFDSMAICKQLVWSTKLGRFTGFVDYAGIIDENSEDLATEALVFQIVSLTGNFKCPIAYFLIDKINSSVQAEIVKLCLSKLEEVGVRVHSVTCDGTVTNIKTLKILGCQFSENGVLSCSFDHPMSHVKTKVFGSLPYA